MQINKTELLEALEIVKPGLANKEIIEQATSFAFLDQRVVTYNDEISISHPVQGLDLQGAIKADNLYKFLGKIKQDELDLELKNNEIILVSGRAKAGLTLQAKVSLPLDKEIAEKSEWYDLPDNFIKFVSFAMTACSKDMSRPILTCVSIDRKGIIVGSDSYRIIRAMLSDELEIESFLLPASGALEVVKLNPTKIAKGKGWMHFKNENETIISCRVMYDKYPDTAPIFKIEGDSLNLPKSIDDVLERAMIFAKRDHSLDEIVYITLQDKKLILSAKSDSAWFKEDINMRYTGEPIEIAITPHLLKAILKETGTCILSDDHTRLKFEGENWIYLTMLRSIK